MTLEFVTLPFSVDRSNRSPGAHHHLSLRNHWPPAVSWSLRRRRERQREHWVCYRMATGILCLFKQHHTSFVFSRCCVSTCEAMRKCTRLECCALFTSCSRSVGCAWFVVQFTHVHCHNNGIFLLRVPFLQNVRGGRH